MLKNLNLNGSLPARSNLVHRAVQARCSGYAQYSWDGAWGMGHVIANQRDMIYIFISDYYYSFCFFIKIKLEGSNAGQYYTIARY